MKTFQDFLNDCYLIEGLTKEQAQEKYARVLQQNPHLIIKNANTTANPNWVIRTRASITRASKERQKKLRAISDKEQMRAGNKKKGIIHRKGFEAHHITPIEHSHALMTSMSPEDWEERKKRDAKIGIYHGHHPRNLQVASGTKSKNKEGILHRSGGIHDLETTMKDVISGPRSKETAISLRDLVATKLKAKRQVERKRNKRNRSISKLQQAKSGKDVQKIIDKL